MRGILLISLPIFMGIMSGCGETRTKLENNNAGGSRVAAADADTNAGSLISVEPVSTVPTADTPVQSADSTAQGDSQGDSFSLLPALKACQCYNSTRTKIWDLTTAGCIPKTSQLNCGPKGSTKATGYCGCAGGGLCQCTWNIR